MSWPPGGNWEGGFRDQRGRHWTHEEGWTLTRHRPYLSAARKSWRARLRKLINRHRSR